MTPRGKPFQFGLRKIFALVLLAALMCWTIGFTKDLRLLLLIALGSAAGILVSPSTIRGSTLGGGVGGALGYWLILPLYIIEEPKPGPFKFGLGLLSAMMLGSVCVMVVGFVLGSGIGAIVGHLRKCQENNQSAEKLIKHLREQQNG